MRRQRTLCGIRIKAFGTLFVSAPLCGDSDLCGPDRNQSAVVGCFERTPLCEDCDLCDQKQITANIAALRVLYHVSSTNHIEAAAKELEAKLLPRGDDSDVEIVDGAGGEAEGEVVEL